MSKSQLPQPPPQSKQSYNLQQATELYDLIHQSLDIRKSLVWNQSIEALKAALMNIEAQETKRFLDQYLLQVINLMTQQNPAKMGNFERGVMEETIITVLNIILRVVAKNPHHLATLSRLLDPSIPFYGGIKVGYTFVPGFPNVRILMAKRFADAKGFEVVAEALSNQHCQWPGSQIIINLLRSVVMNELMNSISDEVRISIIAAVQSMLLKLPDDILKRENTDVLGNIIHIVGKIASSIRHKGVDSKCLKLFHTFWFEHTRKLLRSGSLVVKLFAWDQLIEIINDARLTRPLASSYVVSGAGTSFVNGEYKMIHRNYGNNESMQYTLQTSEPSVPILTLFRCTMRNKEKWWFISKADLEKPGTDKDIDYYLHKSGPEGEREPPSKGWTKSNSGMTLVGTDPAPTLRRKGLILPEGMKPEDFLDAQLVSWCASNDLLGSIFGAGSIHREIVARSSKLLVFLAEYEALNAEHLATIWKSALQTQENDIADEIFGLLVQMSSVITDAMFEGLINLALEALTLDENAQKIASFAEKFTMGGYYHVNQMLSNQSISKLISLVWGLYKKPYFESLKNSAILQDLLSNCFSHSSSLNMVTHRILECKNSLSDLSSGTANSAVDENDASRIIHTLHFLVSKHTSEEMIANLDEQGFAECIIAEIERFVSSTRPKFQNKTIDELKYAQFLSDRLRILRRFYGIHSKVSIPLKSIEELSKLLSANACEIDQFFLFLKSNAQSANAAMVSVEDALNIFKNIICSPQIDWQKCGNGAFQCFRAYFTELEAAATLLPAGTELPPQLGLETLWRIALNATAPFSVDAIALLLEAYETFRDDSAYNGMLKILFGHLEEAVSASKFNSSDTRDKVSRCVSILNSALAKSRGRPGVAHVLRGVMFRINLNVFYRRVNGFFNHTTQSEVTRVEKGTEGLMNLEIHPFHTIKHLKELIAGKLGYIESSITINFDHHNRSMLSDTTRINELNLSDGSELSISYQITFKQFGYTQNRMANNDEDNLMHIGQLLANDYSKFDILLTLCENAMDENMKHELWQLLMLIPSQVDLVEQIKEQICYPESSSSMPLTPGKSNANWNQIIRNASSTRSTYLLQIIDYMLQPAPELCESISSVNPVLYGGNDDQREENSDEGLQRIESIQFRKDFVAINGFELILEKFIEIPSDDNESIINSTASAVALHIIHVLAFGHRRTTDQLSALPVTTATALDLADDSIDVIRPGDTVSITPAIQAAGTNIDCVDDFQWVEKAETFLAHIEDETAAKLLDKLLHVARNAAARGDSGVVENSLMVVTELLIKVPITAGLLARNPQSESLLSTVLRSKSTKVRENASEFAIQVGRSQPIVFTWLLNEFKTMNPTDEDCSEIFSSLNILLGDLHLSSDDQVCASQCIALGEILSEKLASYPRGKLPMQQERYVLLGMLELLEKLLLLRPEAYLTNQSSDSLVKSFLSEFLFTLPSMDGSRDDNAPLCDTPVTRAAAFKVLAALISNSMESFELVLQELSRLTNLAAQRMRNNWGLQVSYAVKKPDMNFSGLKNQGCTCYMNSLLQVLFMNDAFREAVLKTPLLESHRNTLWHRSEVELVGQQLLFEWANGSWQRGQVVGFDPQTSQHRVQYMNDDGSRIDNIVAFPLHSGRIGKETGRIKLLSSIHGNQSSGEGNHILVEVLEDEEPVTERESAAYQVLDQLQRAFCHMKLSQRRFYDPRPLVDACKTLNLNFNVYHQNDAAEFYDQLLDRLETATKGKHSKVKMWDKVFMKNVFGGKWLYQKIPRDCGTFDSNRANCGHWQGSRQESYLKVEILIRGKENIEESLDDFIQGELMDGDNKINCDVCMEKKATVRRTCFDSLPNTLMLHLKRFDLDFQTFETVKLNNRMSFPMKINMFKYTKEGIEVQERKEQQDSKDAEGSEKIINYDHTSNEELNYNITDYDYELQGVLVHAGVAQGGHYYSFIKDPKSDSVSNDGIVSIEASDLEGGNWYKFDDDEVMPFDPQYIPLQCFGGPCSAYSNDNTVNSAHNDEDRTSNALMLVYSKVKKNLDSDESEISSVCEQLKKDSAVSQDSANKKKRMVRIVDGMEAYEREVRESNLHHVLSCFLVDPDLHSFIRGLIASIASHTEANDDPNLISDFGVASRRYDDVHAIPIYDLQWSPLNAVDDLPLRTVQFGCSFLLDVVMHCRERAAIRASVYVLRKLFENHPHTANWFVSHIVDTSVCTWLHSFLLNSTDALARASFVQIVVHAVSVIAPKDTYSIDRFRSQNSGQLMAAVANDKDPALKVALLLRKLLDCIFSAIAHVRTADELFVLIRDLASIPSVCYALQGLGTVGFLSFFAMPDIVPEIVRKLFLMKMSNGNMTGLRSMDYVNLHQSVFEAMAALLGVPQLRKVSLLQERSYWETELVPEAKHALTTIFHEVSRNGGMDANDITRYFERVGGGTSTNPNHRITGIQVRNILDRFPTSSDGRLNLDGFLQYHADAASYNPKNVWRDLHEFGFRNDLSRSSKPRNNRAVVVDVVDENKDMDAVPVDTEDEVLNINENDKHCLANLQLYEAGLSASEAAARAIAKRVCFKDEGMSCILLRQALSKLSAVARENSWNNHTLGIIIDFICLLLGIDDELQSTRLQEVMLHPQWGMAVIADNESAHPSSIERSNNGYNQFSLYDRYIGFAQSICQVPGVKESLEKLAETDDQVKFIRGQLKLRPGIDLTEDEYFIVSNTAIMVQGGGVSEANGRYTFSSIKCNAGYYSMRSNYGGKPACFTLYKCSMRNGGHQWFLSITPDGIEPGSNDDIDFYYALPKQNDILPPDVWHKMNNHMSKDPIPRVYLLRPDGAKTKRNSGRIGDSSSLEQLPHDQVNQDSGIMESSDSDLENYIPYGDDSFVNSELNDTMNSNNSDFNGNMNE